LSLSVRSFSFDFRLSRLTERLPPVLVPTRRASSLITDHE
jgi:hypothetical protein